MKAKTVSLLILLIVLLAFRNPTNVRGLPDQFVINNADDINNLLPVASIDLNTLLSSVQPHFSVRYSNAIQFYDMELAPNDLQSLLSAIKVRPVVEYANAIVNIPLSYPSALIADTSPPMISNVVVNANVGGNAIISWVTDEFTISEVRYGIQTGVYDQTINDPLFNEQHAITISGVIPGSTYYYKIKCTDRSGNAVESQEYHFVATQRIYLPFVKR